MKKCLFLTILLLCGFLFNVNAKLITVSTSTTGSLTFSPSSFTASVGDTVKFVWGKSGSHTTTSTTVPTGAPTWDAPLNSTSTSFLYIIKMGGNYTFRCKPHASMGMVGSFNVASKITVVKSGAVNNCNSLDSIVYQCTQSNPPFKVQLFRYGVAFGSLRTVSNTSTFTIKNLPPGSYFATSKGNNGTDMLAGKSSTTSLVPIPQGVFAPRTGTTTATIKWSHFTCVKFFTVQFRKQGTTTFTLRNTSGNKDSLNLTGLTANTIYEFQVAANDSSNRITAQSKFSGIKTFTTRAAATIAMNSSSAPVSIGKDKALLIYPNPANNSLTIQTNGLRFTSAQLLNEEGVVVWKASGTALTDNNKLNVNVSKLPAGTYFLQFIDINNKQRTEKIVIER